MLILGLGVMLRTPVSGLVMTCHGRPVDGLEPSVPSRRRPHLFARLVVGIRNQIYYMVSADHWLCYV